MWVGDRWRWLTAERDPSIDGIELVGSPPTRTRPIRDRLYASLVAAGCRATGVRVLLAPPLAAGRSSTLDCMLAVLVVSQAGDSLGFVDLSETVVVAAIAALPGALYTWSFEQRVGAWGARTSDRILRFLGIAAAFHALFAPVEVWFWASYLETGRLGSGDVPFALWLAPILYVAIPTGSGILVGWGTRHGKRWATWFTGASPAPRAWDHFFFTEPDGWVRLKLRSGDWMAGAFAREGEGPPSYASGYPEAQDLWLTQVVEVDQATGSFILDEHGDPVRRGSGILIRWGEVEYLEFFDA